MKKILLVVLLTCLGFQGFSESTRLLRFPSISENYIVFSYAGNLYRVSRNGGAAVQLTSDKGYEMFPKISDDETQIAFTGQYDGNTEVYVMSVFGGSPKRLTYTAAKNRDEVDDRMGPNNIVMGWKGDKILFRSRMKTFNPFIGHLFEVPSKGGEYVQLPFSPGSWISYSEDGNKAAYNEIFREFRAWKRYQGGMADDIRVYDFKAKTTINITNNKAQDIFPMWYKNTIYYASDRTGVMNLFAYDLNTKTEKQLTFYKEFDVKFPSLGGKAIVYENGGYIHYFDIEKNEIVKVDIEVQSDNVWSRPEWVDAKDYIHQVDISPNAERLVITARGELFSAPSEKGITYNLTHSSNANDKSGTWSPNGKYIAYVSDETGEDELYVYDLERKEKIQLTENYDSYLWGLSWSPDSKKILFTDRKIRLRYIEVQSKQVVTVAKGDADLFAYFKWSPDSKWIAYSKEKYNAVSRVLIYNLQDKSKKYVTDEWYNSYEPTFSKDGKYLFFVSDRSFKPSYSQTEWNHAYFNLAKIYFIPLEKDIADFNELKNDEVKIKKDSEDKDKKEKDKDSTESKTTNVKVDFESISARIKEVKTPAGKYWNLNFVKGKLYYMYNSTTQEKAEFKLYNFEDEKEHDLGHFSNYQISASGKKVLLYKPKNEYAIVDLPTKSISKSENVSLDLTFLLDKKAEWNQIFYEAHRTYQEKFYAANMHGVNWDSIKLKYEPLLPFVNHRSDLTYILSEMIGELNVGHAYVGKGDVPKADRISVGQLGAEVSKQKDYFRIDKILEGKNWTNGEYSPFKSNSTNVKVGDYILSVNGVSAKNASSIGELLLGQTKKTVELEINDKPQESGARKVLIKPLSEEYELRYYDWVQNNIKKVNEATNGEVGYIHIPDMVSNGLNEFVQYFYPQLHKKVLIIDDRGNGGGNVSQQIIERLNREVLLVNYRKGFVKGNNPYYMHNGPKILLVDQYSASDGDLFAYRFKQLELGPVIGRRTWGGVVGYFGSFKFSDNGYLVVPEFAHYGIEEKDWIIEGVGVEPTIKVNNNAVDEFYGKDLQLEKAIEEAKKKLEEHQPLPAEPKDPVKK